MKRKFLKDTYLKGVSDYDIEILKKDDYYIVVKHIKNIDIPYVESYTGKDICLLNNGYYVLEYVPLNRNYLVRVFLNQNKKVLQYYIDISINQYEENELFYDDMYLDIVIDVLVDYKISLIDGDELEQAYLDNKITKINYELAQKVAEKLLLEINQKSNFFVNQNHKEILNKILK